jgi:DNA-binding GntR family transcriptional regulator
MVFSDLDPVRHPPLSEIAAERLRIAIRHGSLPPGTRLLEREIAEQLNMSRIPVREALQISINEGLVIKIPRRGTFVYAPSDKEIDEITWLRVQAERAVIERVMMNWTPEHEIVLRQIADNIKHSSAQKAYLKIFELDLKFHQKLWAIADHRLLLDYVSSLRSRIGRLFYLAMLTQDSIPADTDMDRYYEMIDALASGNLQKAQTAMTEHILDAQQRFVAKNTGGRA